MELADTEPPDDRVCVAIRIRPRLDRPNSSEKFDAVCVHRDIANVATPSQGRQAIGSPTSEGKKYCVTIVNPETKEVFNFAYDFVLDASDGQEAVYEQVVAPRVADALDASDLTIIAYGQTGSGKTYTMLGDKPTFPVPASSKVDLDDPYCGVYPRLMHSLLEFADKRKTGIHVVITLSVVEIYNDSIRDLLRQKQPVLFREVGEDLCLVDQKLVRIEKEESVRKYFDVAFANRATAQTQLNDESSRSHAIFLIDVYQQVKTSANPRPPDIPNLVEHVFETLMADSQKAPEKEFSARILGKKPEKVEVELSTTEYENPSNNFALFPFVRTRVTLIDLAGSERIKRSGVSGAQLTEALYVNKSLSALGLVVNHLCLGSKHIPFRDSKMTRMLRPAFVSPKAKIVFITNVGPTVSSFPETLGSLRFAQRLKDLRPPVSSLAANFVTTTLLEDHYLRRERQLQELAAELRIAQVACQYERQLRFELNSPYRLAVGTAGARAASNVAAFPQLGSSFAMSTISSSLQLAGAAGLLERTATHGHVRQTIGQYRLRVERLAREQREAADAEFKKNLENTLAVFFDDSRVVATRHNVAAISSREAELAELERACVTLTREIMDLDAKMAMERDTSVERTSRVAVLLAQLGIQRSDVKCRLIALREKVAQLRREEEMGWVAAGEDNEALVAEKAILATLQRRVEITAEIMKLRFEWHAAQRDLLSLKRECVRLDLHLIEARKQLASISEQAGSPLLEQSPLEILGDPAVLFAPGSPLLGISPIAKYFHHPIPRSTSFVNWKSLGFPPPPPSPDSDTGAQPPADEVQSIGSVESEPPEEEKQFLLAQEEYNEYFARLTEADTQLRRILAQVQERRILTTAHVAAVWEALDTVPIDPFTLVPLLCSNARHTVQASAAAATQMARRILEALSSSPQKEHSPIIRGLQAWTMLSNVNPEAEPPSPSCPLAIWLSTILEYRGLLRFPGSPTVPRLPPTSASDSIPKFIDTLIATVNAMPRSAE